MRSAIINKSIYEIYVATPYFSEVYCVAINARLNPWQATEGFLEFFYKVPAKIISVKKQTKEYFIASICVEGKYEQKWKFFSSRKAYLKNIEKELTDLL